MGEWKLEGAVITLYVGGQPVRHIMLGYKISGESAKFFTNELNRSFAKGYQVGKEDGLDEGFANGYHYDENFATAVTEDLKQLDRK